MATLLDRYRFMEAVMIEPALSDLDRRVASRLLHYLNAEQGCSWPSYQRIADDLGSARRSVIRSTERLVARGWFKIVQKGGPAGHASNRYFPDWGVVTARSPVRAKVVTGGAQSGDRPVHQVVTEESPELTYTTSLQTGCGGSATAAPPDGGRLAEVGEHVLTGEIVTDFDDFWSAYPKQEDRPVAEREFNRVLASGEVSAAELIEAARCYAAAKLDVDPRWISLPANWLKGERWRETPRPRSAKPSRRQSLEDTVRGVFDGTPDAEARRRFYTDD